MFGYRLIGVAGSTRATLLAALLLSTSLLMPTAGWAAETRSITIRGSSLGAGKADVPLYSSYYALVIGCGAYRNGWPSLPNPAKDASEVADALRGMGWTVNLLQDPDSTKLHRALNGLMTGPGQDPNRAILLWFSGHGFTRLEADGVKLGYVVPVDAPLPEADIMQFIERAINMRQVETIAKGIMSRHVLMVFDSCFSGAIFQMVRAKPSHYLEEKMLLPVRSFITAGSEDERVPDQSVFKTCFLQGIKDGFADRNRDGYVTGEELGAYLQETVVNYTHKGQHPQFGKINNPKLDKGDFVFVVPAPGRPLVVEERPKVPEAKPTARLKIETSPAGAIVTLDGLKRGPSPVSLADLQPGLHTVRADLDGYLSKEERIDTLAGQETRAALVLSPVQSTGVISVTSQPSGANCYLDGKLVGTTPRELKAVMPGTHELAVEMAGHAKWSQTFQVNPSEKLNMAVALTPAPIPRPGIGSDARPVPDAGPPETGRKLAIFPFLLDQRDAFKSYEYRSQFLDALAATLVEHADQWKVVFTAYPLALKDRPEPLPPSLFGTETTRRIWHKQGGASGFEPAAAEVAQLGKTLGVDAVLTYSVSVAIDAHYVDGASMLQQVQAYAVDVATAKVHKAGRTGLGSLRGSTTAKGGIAATTTEVLQACRKELPTPAAQPKPPPTPPVGGQQISGDNAPAAPISPAGKKKVLVFPFLVNGRDSFRSYEHSSKFLEAVSDALNGVDGATPSSSCYPLKTPSSPALMGADVLGPGAVDRIWSPRGAAGSREPALGVLKQFGRQLDGDLVLLYSIAVGSSHDSVSAAGEGSLEQMEVILVDITDGREYRVHRSSLGNLRMSQTSAQEVTNMTRRVFEAYRNDSVAVK